MSTVSLAPYRRALAAAPLRTALVLGTLVRLPVFASGILLTLHVVSTLGRSYAAAGALTAVATVAIAVSGPWRGRLLDRLGLRRVLRPVDRRRGGVLEHRALRGVRAAAAVLALVAGLFVIPIFSITRQAVIAAVPETERRTAISLDAAAVEVSFMLAPALAVWAAAHWSTSWVLFATQMLAAWRGSPCGSSTPRCAARARPGSGPWAPAGGPGSGSASSPSAWRRWRRRSCCPARTSASSR